VRHNAAAIMVTGFIVVAVRFVRNRSHGPSIAQTRAP
jgi:hypothetical protein